MLLCFLAGSRRQPFFAGSKINGTTHYLMLYFLTGVLIFGTVYQATLDGSEIMADDYALIEKGFAFGLFAFFCEDEEICVHYY
jgi:hypothetical protein